MTYIITLPAPPVSCIFIDNHVVMYVMPVMILLMSLGLSSALSLYWVVGNVFMVGQTLLLNNPFKFQEEQKAIIAQKKRRARALEKAKRRHGK